MIQTSICDVYLPMTDDVEPLPTADLLWTSALKQPIPSVLDLLVTRGCSKMLAQSLEKWPVQVSSRVKAAALYICIYSYTYANVPLQSWVLLNCSLYLCLETSLLLLHADFLKSLCACCDMLITHYKPCDFR